MTRPTLKDIAKIANVHESTVSVALRGDKRIPEATQARIKAIADEIGYRPNLMARGLASQRTHTIGIITPDFTDLYYVDLVHFQKQVLAQNGYCMMLTDFNKDYNLYSESIEQLLSRGVDGLISNAAYLSEAVLQKLIPLSQSGFPISTIGTRSNRHSEFDLIIVDERKIAFDITNYLISLGHSRIVLPAYHEGTEWANGYLDAFKQNNLQPDTSLFISGKYSDLSWLDNILSYKQHATAIMAKNDQLASNIIFALIERGYNVPDDISVTGVNNERFSDRLKIPLTTYHLPKQEIATASISMLIERIEKQREDTQEKVFSGEIIVRETTSKAAAQPILR